MEERFKFRFATGCRLQVVSCQRLQRQLDRRLRGFGEDLLQEAEFMPGCELLEGFAVKAVLEPGAKYSFQGFGQFTRKHAAKDLTADCLIFSKTAADEDVIGIESLTGNFCFGAEAADVTHVMLGT